MGLPLINESVTYKVTIPSTGMTVAIRPYYVKEEKILLIAYESQDEMQVLDAINSTIVACSNGKLDTDKLTIFDIEFLFLKLRSISVGEHAEIILECKFKSDDSDQTVCGEPVEVSINLDAIKMEKLPDKEIKLTDNFTAVMKFPTWKMATELTFKAEGEKTSFVDIFTIASYCIDYIKSEEARYDFSEYSEEEITEFVDGLKSGQINNLMKFVRDIPTISHKLKYTCPKCEKETEVVLRGIQDFF